MKRLIISVGFMLTLFVPSSLVMAQSAVDPFPNDICKGNAAAESPVCKDAKEVQGNSPDSSDDKNPLFGSEGIITRIINILSIVAGIAAVIMIIVSGLKFVTSGSNPQDANNAREGVIYAVAGLVIAGIAQAIVQLFLKKIGAS
jgi:hypothetical protein